MCDIITGVGPVERRVVWIQYLAERNTDLVAADAARLRQRLRKQKQPPVDNQAILSPIPPGRIFWSKERLIEIVII